MDLSFLHQNKYVSATLTLFLILYAGLARPAFPPILKKLFDNPLFKMLILSLIVYSSQKDPKLAIMVAVAFTVTLNLLSEQEIKESFDQ